MSYVPQYLSATETNVITKLFEMLEANGWFPTVTDDGEESHETHDLSSALEVIDSVEMAHTLFHRREGIGHTVVFITGNGRDIISDYSYSEHDDFDETLKAHGEWVVEVLRDEAVQ